ncbi:dipicolinate synthase subunit A [Fictibacillus macauensis ZFHKF-1]|uniref:Dipicolinate synthase subunit A n=1 Tax=Fictibacillus macauensis ZFHKF-1 TaxID=1196324 RepID=I8AI47_9BACL|nr:dipicolinic acid synthetase subunit A [Fictibacillus macauensis]EIT85129.1 dipicolinate synthase subunit A [Fictibacillus macauensis ZFHKF-1]
MLTDCQVAVIGGDARQLEVIRKLSQLDANLILIGFDQLDHGFTGASKTEITEVNFSRLDFIILPVNATGPHGEIDTIFSNKKIQLTVQQLQQTPQHCCVFSGITNDYLDGIIKESGRKHIQLFERDDVAIYNSIPTAEGTIMMVIQNTDTTIHQSTTAILGFGRVGVSVARAFAALGAKVKVGARRPEHLARISEMGLTPFHLDQLEKEMTTTDVCINTIPSLILTSKVISKLPPHTLIIDLASKPGGTDFKYAEKRGIKALLAPGLPGIVAPKTAGQILGKVLAQLMLDERRQRDER